MSYNVLPLPPFDRQLKRLSKKYPSLKQEYFELIELLEENPEQDVSLRDNCYKIRISIASKNKGKSGGARVIINIVLAENNVYLLAIYDKSEKESLSDKELNELLKFIP